MSGKVARKKTLRLIIASGDGQEHDDGAVAAGHLIEIHYDVRNERWLRTQLDTADRVMAARFEHRFVAGQSRRPGRAEFGDDRFWHGVRCPRRISHRQMNAPGSK